MSLDGAQVDGVQPGVQRASQIQAAIAALEVQRPVLGDDIVDLAVAPLRAALQVADGDAGDLPQIKHLTILFVDVVGSTATGQTMHPEDFNDLMEAAMRSFTGTIQAHNGEVLKYTGDGLLATFGGQQARDDDAENAVLAGLSILDEARRIAADIAASLNASFNVRVGVDTGTVLLGGGVEGSSNIRGNAVNLAARMEQAAPINGLRISHHTYQLVRGLFDVVEERSTQVKGIATPIPTFVVVGRAAADGSAPHRNDDYTVPMIAREAELNLLCEAFLHTPDLLGPRFITIVAEGGVGKSRLVREFALWLAARSPQATMLVAAAVPQSVQRPFGMLRSLLVSRCGITDSDTAEIARQKLRDTLIPLFDGDGEDHIHLLGHLAGFDFSVSPHVRGILNDAAQIRTRAFRAAAQMLRNLASGSEPVVVLLDDLQWADDGLFDLLQHFNDNEPDLSLLVVGAARPGLSDRRPGWTQGLRVHELVALAPLGVGAARQLSDQLLRRLDAVPASIRTLIDRADGNPFFIEEIVRMLLDEGVIAHTEADSWQVSLADLQALQIPTTLMGVLQVRLDALAGADRIALQQASVVGFVFWDRAIAALDPKSPLALASLTERGLVVPQAESSLAEARELTFQHHILHQFTYDSLLKRERIEYHARAARWLIDLAEVTSIEFPAAIAEHLEHAGKARSAAGYYLRATHDAQARSASDLALVFIERGLALIAAEDNTSRWAFVAAREHIASVAADLDRVRADLDELDALAQALDDDAKRAIAAVRRAGTCIERADMKEAIRIARIGVGLAERVSATDLICRGLSLEATALRRMGQLDESLPLAQRALSLATASDDRASENRLLTTLSNTLAERGDLVSARDAAEQGLANVRDLKDLIGEADLLFLVGWINSTLGEFDIAKEQLTRSYQLSTELGWVYGQCISLFNLACALTVVGDHDEAISAATQSVEFAVKGGSLDVQAGALHPLGLSLIALGRWAEARVALTRSRDLKFETDSPHCAHEVTASLARLHLAMGDIAGAVAEVDVVLRYLRNGGSLDGTDEPIRTRLICWEVLNAAGDQRSGEVLAEAYAALYQLAERIPDDVTRNRFLHEVPHHHAVLLAWEAQ